MTLEEINQIAKLIEPLTMLKFFPADDGGRLAVMQLIGNMAANEAQVRWLVNRMLNLFDEWPGPRTMRTVFCQKFKPRDGIDLRTAFISQYPDGIPSEKAIDPPALPALPPGHQFTADPQLEAAVAQAFEDMPKMPEPQPLTGHAARFARELEDAITAPQDRRLPPAPTNPNYRPVTQEDIDRAVAEYRRRKGEVTE